MRNRKRASKGKRIQGTNGAFGGTKADYKIVKKKVKKYNPDGTPVLTKSGKHATKTVKRIVGRTVTTKGTVGAKRGMRVLKAKRI